MDYLKSLLMNDKEIEERKELLDYPEELERTIKKRVKDKKQKALLKMLE